MAFANAQLIYLPLGEGFEEELRHPAYTGSCFTCRNRPVLLLILVDNILYNIFCQNATKFYKKGGSFEPPFSLFTRQ